MNDLQLLDLRTRAAQTHDQLKSLEIDEEMVAFFNREIENAEQGGNVFRIASGRISVHRMAILADMPRAVSPNRRDRTDLWPAFKSELHAAIWPIYEALLLKYAASAARLRDASLCAVCNEPAPIVAPAEREARGVRIRERPDE